MKNLIYVFSLVVVLLISSCGKEKYCQYCNQPGYDQNGQPISGTGIIGNSGTYQNTGNVAGHCDTTVVARTNNYIVNNRDTMINNVNCFATDTTLQSVVTYANTCSGLTWQVSVTSIGGSGRYQLGTAILGVRLPIPSDVNQTVWIFPNNPGVNSDNNGTNAIKCDPIAATITGGPGSYSYQPTGTDFNGYYSTQCFVPGMNLGLKNQIYDLLRPATFNFVVVTIAQTQTPIQ